MNFFNTFRGRLLVVLAVLLLVTLGVQYALNLRTERVNKERRERQEKAIVAGITLGFNSLSAKDRLAVFKDSQPYFTEHAERIADILMIDEEWQVYDSLQPDYAPKMNNGAAVYHKLIDLTELPPMLDTQILGDDRARFPNAVGAVNKNEDRGEAHAIPVETTEYGRWYVMVLLKSESGESAWRAAQPLVYTLAVLLISTLLTVFLVWRFTRPIANLSAAAQRVAEGDLTVRVQDTQSSDEMGRLTAQFNEMIVQLDKSRELEAQLQQAEKSAVVGRLASAIAHEIRNPLNYINLTLDHLRVKFVPENDEQKREVFERLTSQLKSEVARINHQITDFLRYSRPLQINLQPTNLRQVVDDSLRIVEAQAAEQNIAVEIAETSATPLILGDAEFLRSVFNNLFVNAVQAMSDGDKLTTKISAANDFVTVEIADTGAGIKPENLDKIFEPYFSTKETGTGLGLAIVKKIVDDHNGEITVTSKLNEGTIFTVKLPKN